MSGKGKAQLFDRLQQGRNLPVTATLCLATKRRTLGIKDKGQVIQDSLTDNNSSICTHNTEATGVNQSPQAKKPIVKEQANLDPERLTCSFCLFPTRRGDRVADCARLEIVCALTGTEGSNPSLSAIFRRTPTRCREGKPTPQECRNAVSEAKVNPSLSASSDEHRYALAMPLGGHCQQLPCAKPTRSQLRDRQPSGTLGQTPPLGIPH